MVKTHHQPKHEEKSLNLLRNDQIGGTVQLMHEILLAKNSSNDLRSFYEHIKI